MTRRKAPISTHRSTYRTPPRRRRRRSHAPAGRPALPGLLERLDSSSDIAVVDVPGVDLLETAQGALAVARNFLRGTHLVKNCRNVFRVDAGRVERRLVPFYRQLRHTLFYKTRCQKRTVLHHMGVVAGSLSNFLRLLELSNRLIVEGHLFERYAHIVMRLRIFVGSYFLHLRLELGKDVVERAGCFSLGPDGNRLLRIPDRAGG